MLHSWRSDRGRAGPAKRIRGFPKHLASESSPVFSMHMCVYIYIYIPIYLSTEDSEEAIFSLGITFVHMVCGQL